MGRAGAAVRVRDEARQGDRRPGALGAGRGADQGGPRPRPASTYEVKPKDGTFYAPKIDIYIDDALGREWQMATIQADLTMLPERFDLTYIDEDGQPQRPIAIHRAIYGSLERFIGILVEHFAGAFPLWLAPVQAVVIPIADRHVDAARGAGGRAARRAACGWRSTTPTTGCRTRSGSAQEQKVPYMVVLGDREIEARDGVAARRGRASSSRPSHGTRSPTGSPAESAARAGRLRASRSARIGASARDCSARGPVL